MKNNNKNKKSINKKKVLFIVLLCVNVVFFVFSLLTSMPCDPFLVLPNVIYSQLIVSSLSVVIYCSIDLVDAVKKIANQKETNNTTLPEEKKEDHE